MIVFDKLWTVMQAQDVSTYRTRKISEIAYG